MSSPTKAAEDAFNFAKQSFGKLQHSDDKGLQTMNMSRGLLNLAAGLENLSKGVRATYMLLEEIQKEMQQQNQGRRP